MKAYRKQITKIIFDMEEKMVGFDPSKNTIKLEHLSLVILTQNTYFNYWKKRSTLKQTNIHTTFDSFPKHHYKTVGEFTVFIILLSCAETTIHIK